MKKILMVILALFILFGVQESNAQTYKLTLEKQKGIYYVRKGGTLPYKSSQYSIYKLGENIAYCIEPSHNITTFNYMDSGEYIELDYEDDVKEKLELIGYYGREYPNHNTVYYSMATQALIWELTGTGEVTFWTEKDGKGNEINVSKERDEIMSLVNNHKDVPNIPSKINLSYKEKIVYEDELLNDFYISDDGGNDATIENNKLHLTGEKIGNSAIKLSRKSYDNMKTLIFVGKDSDNSQTLGRLRFSKEVSLDVNVNTGGIKLKIVKVDENSERIKKEGIKFKIKNLETGEYLCNSECEFKTNKDGVIIVNNLHFGKYEIEEVEDQVTLGYTWNKEKFIVDINDNNLSFNKEDNYFVEVSFVNKKVIGSVEILKKGEEYLFDDNSITYQKKDLEGVKFKIYDNNDNYINIVTTNNDGYAKYDNLNVGKYYLVECETNANYVLSDLKYFFEIKQDNQYDEKVNAKLEIDNYLKKGTLDFTKSDLVTGEGIPNTIIEIYNDQDTLLLTKETDEKGKVVIEKLPVGKYYIIEKEANSLYQITNERVYFEIKDNSEIVKAYMTNEKIVVPVPKTGRYDNLYIELVCGVLFLLGLGGIIYEKKTN